MSILHITIGIAGAGKDYWCDEFKAKNPEVVIVSSDAIRQEIYKDVNDQNHNKEVFEIMFNRAVAALSEGKEVIYNSTNLNRKRRIALISNIKAKVKNVDIEYVVFAIPYEQILINNTKRERHVPEEVIKRMYYSFDTPLPYERYSYIKLVRWCEAVPPLEDLLQRNIETPHDNINHSLSCGEHCLAAQEYIKQFDDSFFKDKEKRILSLAARYHDVSKYKVKTFYRYNGELDTNAHYYNHERVSAYDFLSHYNGRLSTYERFLVAALIDRHMIFYDKNVNLTKLSNKYGYRFLKLLCFLHDADKAAH